jgi:hypothetical protein
LNWVLWYPGRTLLPNKYLRKARGSKTRSMLDTGALDSRQSIIFMHAAAVYDNQTAFRTHLHDIMSNHINAPGIVSQPAAAFRHSDKRRVGRFEKPRRCLLQWVLTWRGPSANCFISTSDPDSEFWAKAFLPKNKSDLSCSKGDL